MKAREADQAAAGHEFGGETAAGEAIGGKAVGGALELSRASAI
jgi:hypothetical protein